MLSYAQTNFSRSIFLSNSDGPNQQDMDWNAKHFKYDKLCPRVFQEPKFPQHESFFLTMPMNKTNKAYVNCKATQTTMEKAQNSEPPLCSLKQQTVCSQRRWTQHRRDTSMAYQTISKELNTFASVNLSSLPLLWLIPPAHRLQPQSERICFLSNAGGANQQDMHGNQGSSIHVCKGILTQGCEPKFLQHKELWTGGRVLTVSGESSYCIPYPSTIPCCYIYQLRTFQTPQHIQWKD